jgi:hypothetical protein
LQVGEKVDAGDVLMVVESDKADMDVEVRSTNQCTAYRADHRKSSCAFAVRLCVSACSTAVEWGSAWGTRQTNEPWGSELRGSVVDSA